MCNPDGISRHAPTRTAPPRTIASLPPGERQALQQALTTVARVAFGHELPYAAVVTMLESALMDAEDDRVRALGIGWPETPAEEG